MTAIPIGSDDFYSAPTITVKDAESPVFSNAGYTRQDAQGEPGPKPNRTAWWRFEPPVPGDYILHTDGAEGDTYMLIQISTTPATPTFDSLVLVDWDDDSGDGDYRSRMSVELIPGVTYFITVGSWYDEDVDYKLTIVGPDVAAGGGGGGAITGNPVYIYNGTEWIPLGGGGTTILHGTAPPSKYTGFTGNYYLDIKDNTLWGPKETTVYSDPVGPFDTVTDPFDVDFTGDFRIATEFEVTNNATVTGLRFWRHGGSGLTSRVLELYVDEDLVSKTPPTVETAGYEGWVTANLPLPYDIHVYNYVTVVTKETIQTRTWMEYQPIPPPRIVEMEPWSYTAPSSTTDYPGNHDYQAVVFPLDFITTEIVTPAWTDNILSERTRGIWEYGGEYLSTDVIPNPVPTGTVIAVYLADDPISTVNFVEYRFSCYDMAGYDRSYYFSASDVGDTIIFHEQDSALRRDNWDSDVVAILGFNSEPIDSNYHYDNYVTLEKSIGLTAGTRYCVYPVTQIDDTNEGIDAEYLWRGSSQFYTANMADCHMSFDIDPATVTERDTPALMYLGTHALNGLESIHSVNGISPGDTILLSTHNTDVIVSSRSYKARVAGEGFFSWIGAYGIPLMLDPPPTGKEVPNSMGQKVRLRVSVSAMDGVHTAGFMGAWSSTREYPPGSIVTYGGFTWGAEKGAPKGLVPTDVPVTPGGTLSIPTGSNAIASAPTITIPPGNTYAESAYHYGGSYNSETNEPNGVNTITHSGRTIWWKYLPTVSGTFGVQAKERDYNYPCNIDVFRLRAPTYTSFSDLTLLGGGLSIAYDIWPITVTAGPTYYLRLSGRGVDYLYYRMQLTKAMPTTPMDYWVKL